MEEQKKIITRISKKDGSIKIETVGFVGESCITESQFLKDVLGKEVARELKPVYWENETEHVKKHLPLCG